MKRILIIILFILVLILAISPSWANSIDDVIIQRGDYMTTYSIKGIPIVLTVHHGGDEGVWGLGQSLTGEKSNQSIDWQVAVMEKLLSAALEDQKKIPRMLSVGRLVETFGHNKEISKRLAEAARTSALWDKKRGKGLKGRDNSAVKTILNENNIYHELIEMFKKHGLIIKVAYVEKVLVGKNKLPYDCMVWFSVNKK